MSSRKGLVVISLFDGMSCGQIALERAGIKVDKYYASEIDKYAIKVTQTNYPNTIQLGRIDDWEKWDIERPDIIIGGSPCQGFSFAGAGLNFNDPRSKLFFTFVDIVKHYNPKYFLLENVKMAKEHENIINQYMGIQPVQINSGLVSAQNRERLYWTNIKTTKGLFGEDLPGIEQPKDKKIYLKDIVESGELDRDKSYCIVTCGRIIGRPIGNHKSRISGQETEQILELREDEKTNCLSTVQKDNVIYYNIEKRDLKYRQNAPVHISKNKFNTLNAQAGSRTRGIGLTTDGTTWRKLTPIECERLQTVSDNYTNHVSDTQRYKMLGNGWTIDVIAHIFKGIND